VLWTRLGPAGGASLERAIWPTPYVAETMVEDVFGAGPDARLEVTVPSRPDFRLEVTVPRKRPASRVA
jgi:hypothetical protein